MNLTALYPSQRILKSIFTLMNSENCSYADRTKNENERVFKMKWKMNFWYFDITKMGNGGLLIKMSLVLIVTYELIGRPNSILWNAINFFISPYFSFVSFPF